MSFSQADYHYMARAIELAYKGRFTTAPNPNVGCVIVKDHQIVGEGFHLKRGLAHAEVNALAMAMGKAKEATAYVTLEPCSHYGTTPPCVDALMKAGVKRVVAAMKDPNPLVAGNGLAKLAQNGVQVECGLMAEEAEALNPGFLKRMRTGRPYVRLKLAASLDGKTAMASGESKWITGPLARQDVQVFRAQSDAILSTSATVLADDPALTVRWHELDDETKSDYPQSFYRPPVRVIIDSQRRVLPSANLFQQTGETWLFQLDQQVDQHPCQQLSFNQCRIFTAPSDEQHRIDLLAMLRILADKHINLVWVEAGAHLAGALISQHLIDELIVYVAPKLLGEQARGLCHLPHLQHLSDVPHFRLKDVRAIGHDVRLSYSPI